MAAGAGFRSRAERAVGGWPAQLGGGRASSVRSRVPRTHASVLASARCSARLRCVLASRDAPAVLSMAPQSRCRRVTRLLLWALRRADVR